MKSLFFWVLITVGVLSALTALSGCGYSDAYRGAAAETGAEAADDVLETGVWTVCQASTIGSVRRAYGGSVDQAKKYAAFCGTGGEGTADLVRSDDTSGN
jgi:hypothetical protein